MTLEPIGVFYADSKHPYEAPRQGVGGSALGEIRLRAGLEQALADLDGFERIWIVYQFHQNPDWKPKVMPPRGPRVKRGVFATRAPYRPNALGLSCVRLLRIEGLSVFVEGHDLLDYSPVFDIKPYLPYADSFPDSKVGWLEDVESERWAVEFGQQASEQIAWLEKNGVSQLRGFLQGQLEFDPIDHKRKRVSTHGGGYQLAYRTWRVSFTLNESARSIQVLVVSSGYSEDDLLSNDDLYRDKALHRAFIKMAKEK